MGSIPTFGTRTSADRVGHRCRRRRRRRLRGRRRLGRGRRRLRRGRRLGRRRRRRGRGGRRRRRSPASPVVVAGGSVVVGAVVGVLRRRLFRASSRAVRPPGRSSSRSTSAARPSPSRSPASSPRAGDERGSDAGGQKRERRQGDQHERAAPARGRWRGHRRRRQDDGDVVARRGRRGAEGLQERGERALVVLRRGAAGEPGHLGPALAVEQDRWPGRATRASRPPRARTRARPRRRPRPALPRLRSATLPRGAARASRPARYSKTAYGSPSSIALVEERHDARVRESGDGHVAGGHLHEDVALELGVGGPPGRAAELLEQLVPSGDPARPHAGAVPQQDGR